MKKNNKKNNVYATVTLEDGVNYREIADMMTGIGYKMNHSSARNYVLRIMQKFAHAIAIDGWGLEISEDKLTQIVKTPAFQEAINDVLQTIKSRSR